MNNKQPRCKTVEPVTGNVCNRRLWTRELWCEAHGDLQDQPRYSQEAHFGHSFHTQTEARAA